MSRDNDCKCGAKLRVLKTTHGDPEGIRSDMRCPRCWRWYACHKWGLREVRATLGLLVGEAPGPRQPVHEVFTGPSGAFLDRLLGRPWSGVLVGVNLLDHRQPLGSGGSHFPAREGAAAASMLMRTSPWIEDGRRAFLAGRRVAAAFGVGPEVPYFRVTKVPLRGRYGEGSLLATVVPHPSGRCRWWNDARNRARARAYFQKLLKLTPPRDWTD